MKTVRALALCLVLTAQASAQEIRYTFAGTVSMVFQSDVVEPLHQWGSSVFVGAPVTLTIRADMAQNAPDSPQYHFLEPVAANLWVGDFSFSSDLASFALGKNIPMDFDYRPTDILSTSFISLEEYFGSPFRVSGSIYIEAVPFLDSVDLLPFPLRSIPPGSGSHFSVGSPEEQFWFRLDEVSAVIIPEPAGWGVLFGLLGGLLAIVKRHRRGTVLQSGE